MSLRFVLCALGVVGAATPAVAASGGAPLAASSPASFPPSAASTLASADAPTAAPATTTSPPASPQSATPANAPTAASPAAPGAPIAEPAPAAGDHAITTSPSASTELNAKPEAFSLLSAPLGAGAGAAIVSVPASLALATWIGSLSNNLILAALPTVVAFVAIPPIAVVLAEWAVANALHAGSAKLSPALWATLGAQVIVMVGAIALGIHAGNFLDASVLTLVEAIVLPATSWLVMRATPPPPAAVASAATTSALEVRLGLPQIANVRVASWSF